MEEHVSPGQLFNTSWRLHRLSPLHHDKEFKTLLHNKTALRAYATRLRDQLIGDARGPGLHFALGTVEDDALSKAGAFKKCLWQSFETGPGPTNATFPGILVTLEYENVTYKASLLAEPDSITQPREGVTVLPLLMTKLPNSLRQTFLNFLNSNFDTCCSDLKLYPTILCKGLESYLDILRSSTTRADADDLVEETIKELQLTLGFAQPVAPSLKTLNVKITPASVVSLLRGNAVTAKGKGVNRTPQNSLIENLSSYLETHLALKVNFAAESWPDQTHKPVIQLARITSAAFVLTSEGRMKLIVDPKRMDLDESEYPALRASGALLRAIIAQAVLPDQWNT